MNPASTSSNPAGIWIGVFLAVVLLGYGIVESFFSSSNPRCSRGLIFVYVALLIQFLGIGLVKQFPGSHLTIILIAAVSLPAIVTGVSLAITGLRQQTRHHRYRRGTLRGTLALILAVPALVALPAIGMLRNDIVAATGEYKPVANTTPVPLPVNTPLPTPTPDASAILRAVEIEDIRPRLKKSLELEDLPPKTTPTPTPTPSATPVPTPKPKPKPRDPNEPYVFEEQNFKFTVPPNWSLTKSARIPAAAIIALQCEKPQAFFMVAVEKPGVESKEIISTVVASAKSELKQADKEAKVLAEKTGELNGIPFTELESTAKINGISFFYVHHLSIVGGIVYQQVAWGREQDRDAIRTEAGKLTANFSLINPEFIFHKPDTAK